MQTHPKDIELQRCGCGALAILALSKEHIPQMVECGCVEVVQATMSRYAKDAEVQRLGQKAVHNMLQYDLFPPHVGDDECIVIPVKVPLEQTPAGLLTLEAKGG